MRTLSVPKKKVSAVKTVNIKDSFGISPRLKPGKLPMNQLLNYWSHTGAVCHEVCIKPVLALVVISHCNSLKTITIPIKEG